MHWVKFSVLPRAWGRMVMENSSRDLRAVLCPEWSVCIAVYMTDVVCHEEELEVWVSGENEDSWFCCIGSVVHKDAGGANGFHHPSNQFGSWFLPHIDCLWHAINEIIGSDYTLSLTKLPLKPRGITSA